MRAWRRSDWVTEVPYYCEPGQTRRAVERAAHMPELTAHLVPGALMLGLGAAAGFCALLLLRAVLVDAAARAGMLFREWSPSGSTVYNPFERGNPTEIAGKAHDEGGGPVAADDEPDRPPHGPRAP